jgi:hypothetical protein
VPDGLEAIDYAYLTKPVKREDLERTIEMVCPSAGQE